MRSVLMMLFVQAFILLSIVFTMWRIGRHEHGVVMR